MRSSGLRKPSNMVPRRALNVALHALQRYRCLFRSWMTILPFPLWPLAEHIEFGKNACDGSIGSGVLFCISTSCQRPLIFSTPPPLHRLVGFYLLLQLSLCAKTLKH